MIRHRTGHPRLMSVVRKLGMRTGSSRSAKNVVLECQVSMLDGGVLDQ